MATSPRKVEIKKIESRMFYRRTWRTSPWWNSRWWRWRRRWWSATTPCRWAGERPWRRPGRRMLRRGGGRRDDHTWTSCWRCRERRLAARRSGGTPVSWIEAWRTWRSPDRSSEGRPPWRVAGEPWTTGALRFYVPPPTQVSWSLTSPFSTNMAVSKKK